MLLQKPPAMRGLLVLSARTLLAIAVSLRPMRKPSELTGEQVTRLTRAVFQCATRVELDNLTRSIWNSSMLQRMRTA